MRLFVISLYLKTKFNKFEEEDELYCDWKF